MNLIPADDMQILQQESIPDSLASYYFRTATRYCLTGTFGHLLVQEYYGTGFTIFHYTAIIPGPVTFALAGNAETLQVISSMEGLLTWKIKSYGSFTCHPLEFTLQYLPYAADLTFNSAGTFQFLIVQFTKKSLSRLNLNRSLLTSLHHCLQKHRIH